MAIRLSKYAPRALGGTLELDEEDEISQNDFLKDYQRAEFTQPTVRRAPMGQQQPQQEEEQDQMSYEDYKKIEEKFKKNEEPQQEETPATEAATVAAPVAATTIAPTAPVAAPTPVVSIVDPLPGGGFPATPAPVAATPVAPAAPAVAATPATATAPAVATPTAAAPAGGGATATGFFSTATPYIAFAVLMMYLNHQKVKERMKNKRDRWRDYMISIGQNPNKIQPGGGSSPSGPSNRILPP